MFSFMKLYGYKIVVMHVDSIFLKPNENPYTLKFSEIVLEGGQF
jgi:hypothetical protein